MPHLPETHRTNVTAPKHERPLTAEDKRKAYARQYKRALPTNSTAWEKLRACILRHEPVCRHCKEEGRITPATEVDHINGDATSYQSNDIKNLQALCKTHHSRKTASEMNRLKH